MVTLLSLAVVSSRVTEAERQPNGVCPWHTCHAWPAWAWPGGPDHSSLVPARRRQLRSRSTTRCETGGIGPWAILSAPLPPRTGRRSPAAGTDRYANRRQYQRE